jgi:ABC-2 type transport system permease protein
LQADLAIRTPVRAERSPGTLVARLTARKAVRSGVIWGYIFAVFVASSALSYTAIYKTRAERNHLAAAFGSNRASSAVFGPAPRLQTVAGFTVFKTSLTLMILGAVWALLTSTRLLRGEEESGRWDLLLTGQTTRRGAAAQVLLGLSAGVFTLWAITAVVTALTGLSSKVDIAAGPALYFALALVSTAVMFLAVGVLTSQLAATRRQAASYAAAVLGASYAVRLVADAGIGFHWLIWASPLGWVEQLRPLTAPEPLALVPIAAFTAVVAAIGVHLAGRRDLGASTLPDRASAQPHLRLLSGPVGLTVRLMRPTVISWWVAIAMTGFLTGLVAEAAGGTISGSSVQQVFSRLGAPGSGARAFLGVSFLIVAILVAFVAGGQITAARAEESGGRLEHLLVRPVSRSSWFGGRLLVAAAVLVASGAGAGLFTWLGTASQRSGLSLATLMGAGLNVVPPAFCILGIGALAVGFWPRASSLVMYGLLGWSLLVELIGGIGASSHWVLDTSVFHQMASSPAVEANWEASSVMLAIGLVTALAGCLAFIRRDLRGE